MPLLVVLNRMVFLVFLTKEKLPLGGYLTIAVAIFGCFLYDGLLILINLFSCPVLMPAPIFYLWLRLCNV